MTDNKRAYKRCSAILRANYTLPDGTSFPADIIDITPEGIAFTTKIEIKADVNEFELTITLIRGDKIHFHVQAMRHESLAEGVYKIGVKILSGSDSDRMLLSQFYLKKMWEEKN